MWCLDLVSFEAVHGISRVLRLIPDKLATSLAINKENLPDPDDGGFLIVLVSDLLDHFPGHMIGDIRFVCFRVHLQADFAKLCWARIGWGQVGAHCVHC